MTYSDAHGRCMAHMMMPPFPRLKQCQDLNCCCIPTSRACEACSCVLFFSTCVARSPLYCFVAGYYQVRHATHTVGFLRNSYGQCYTYRNSSVSSKKQIGSKRNYSPQGYLKRAQVRASRRQSAGAMTRTATAMLATGSGK